jgi:hypothetical protein
MPDAHEERLAELERRCRGAGLAVEDATSEDEDDQGNIYRSHHGWLLGSANGAFQEQAHLQSEEDIEFALSTTFQDFRPVAGHEAVWSSGRRVVEAELVVETSTRWDKHPLHALARNAPKGHVTGEHQSTTVRVPTRTGQPAISVRYGSPELLVWRTCSPAVHLIAPEQLVPVLLIEGVDLPSEVVARDALRSWGNAALMEIDRCVGVPMRLRTHYPWRIDRLLHPESRPAPADLGASPDATPWRLFCHARQAPSDDLAAQFLGFYQTLEYYLPRASLAAEGNRLRSLLTSQAATLASVSDVDLRSIVRETHRGRGVGAELEQFKQVVAAIISADDLRTHIQSASGLSDFYSSVAMPFVAERVRVDSKNLGAEVASRLYKIRCRIVHTKELVSEDVFVPFSAEAADLFHDVRLISFLAQRALSHYATPLPAAPGP